MNFVQFAEMHGLIIDHLIEGRWARAKTIDKPRKRNGSYKFLRDVGFVQNHANMAEVAIWRPHDSDRSEMVSQTRVLKEAALQQEARKQAAARELAQHML